MRLGFMLRLVVSSLAGAARPFLAAHPFPMFHARARIPDRAQFDKVRPPVGVP
jgi:hypothetical protein